MTMEMKRRKPERNAIARRRYSAAYGAPALRSLWRTTGRGSGTTAKRFRKKKPISDRAVPRPSINAFFLWRVAVAGITGAELFAAGAAFADFLA